MKPKITFLGVIFLFALSGKAQTTLDSIAAQYDQLPSSLYPSQILHNRSPLYFWCFNIDSTLTWTLDTNNQTSPYLYPGTIPSKLIKPNNWGSLYADMFVSSVNPALIPDAATLETRDSIAKTLYEVPIGAMHLKFHRLMPYALDSGFVTYDMATNKYGVMPDTLWLDRQNGIYQYNPNPDSLAALAFEEYEMFAGILTEGNIYKPGTNFTITFGLASSLFMENQTEQITYSEMDFDNGQGFVPMPFDIPKTVFYNYTLPIESYTKKLRLRLHYGEKVVETTMPLGIIPNAPVPDQSFNTSSLNFECPVPTGGYSAAQARVSILYGNPGQQILKPLLLVEGFEGDTRDYGAIHFSSLASGVILDRNQIPIYPHMKLFKNAIDSLHLLGYDIIFIDFKNGRAPIQANSLSVIKTIQWINTKLSENSSYEKLVVTGASMGGLITRYSLAKMEADGCCHNTRLYVTWDTPHNGANIPEGLQYAVKHLHDELGYIDDILNGVFGLDEKVRPSWKKVLNSTAARQMLVNHIDPSAKADHDAFFYELDSLGHPSQCRRVALMSGSEQGLANTIPDGWKTFFWSSKFNYLPAAHFVGTLWQPFVNIVGFPMPYTVFKFNAYGEGRSDGLVFESNKIQRSTLLATSILGTHGFCALMEGISKSISIVCSPCTPAAYAVILANENAANIALPPLHAANFISTAIASGVSTPTGLNVNYTEAPGGTSNTPETIVQSLGGIALLVTDYHSFIPSVSAIDIDTSDVYLDIEFNRSQLLNGYIPFDSYWAPGRADGQSDENQKHVEVTNDNYTWLIEQVEKDDELRHPITGAYYTQLSGYYNFGRPSGTNWDKPFLKHLYSVDIKNGGTLHVNHAGKIGFIGGSYSTAQNSKFTCYTGQSCEQPVVRIKNGGRFEIGQSSTGNIGEMRFLSGSTLEIEGGGVLKIGSGSLFELALNAELILHPGAIIETEVGSTLILEGKVTLLDGAGFSPIGGGDVILRQPMNSAADADLYWNVSGGGYISIEGENVGKIHFENTHYFSAKLDSVSFRNTTIPLSPSVGVHILNSPYIMKSVDVIGADSTQYHKGIHLYGQNVQIRDCRVKHGRQGIYNNMTLGGIPMKVVNSEFRHNQIGLYARDGSLDIYNCIFKNNSTGIRFWDAQGALNVVEGVIARNLDKGIDASGQTGSYISLNEVALNDNATAVYAVEMDVKSKCSNFSNSNIGIYANGRSYVFIGDEAHNLFQGNQTSVKLNYVSGIFTENGANNFSGSQWYIQGELTPRNANPNIDLSGNKMQGSVSIGGSASVPIYVFWTDISTSMPHAIPLENWDPGVSVNITCVPPAGSANPGNDLASDVIRSYSSGKVINTSNYPNTWLNDALADAAYNVSNEGGVYDDLTAIARFSEIFEGINGDLTDSEQEALNYAIELMITSLNNAYDQGLLAKNHAVDNEPESSYLKMVTDQIDAQLSQVNISTEKLFQLNLALAQTYRMAEHYDYAQSTLNAMGTTLTIEELLKTEYWECVCEAEDELLKGEIDQTMFAVQQGNCQMLLENGMKMMSQECSPKSSLIESMAGQLLVKSLFPNPTTGRVVLEFTEEIDHVTFQLHDLNGKVIKSGEWSNLRSTSVDLSELDPGIYLLSIISDGKSETQQIVLAK